MNSNGSSDAPSGGGQVKVGQLTVAGLDAASARRLGPALTSALRQVSDQGSHAGAVKRISMSLPPGANEHDVAAAIVKAIAGGPPRR